MCCFCVELCIHATETLSFALLRIQSILGCGWDLLMFLNTNVCGLISTSVLLCMAEHFLSPAKSAAGCHSSCLAVM